MRDAGVDEDLVLAALGSMSTARVLPFRFLAAARYAPQWEEALEQAMLKCVAGQEKLRGQDHRAGRRLRLDDRSALAAFRDAAHRRGLRPRGVAARDRREGRRCSASPTRWSRFRRAADSLCATRSTPRSRTRAPCSATPSTELNQKHGYDRLIVITDEQAHDTVPAPQGKGYVINVASYKNGVGYGKWTHIDGWSESVVEYIRALERGAE